MATLWEKRQQQLAKRGQQPNAPSVRPAAGLIEPPASVAHPAAPVVPSVAPKSEQPAQAPEPVAPVEPKAKLPPLSSRKASVAPVAPAEKPPSAEPKSAPAPSAPAEVAPEPVAVQPSAVAQSPAPAADETSSGSFNLKSGEMEIVSEEQIAPSGPVSTPGAPAPEQLPAEAPSLSSLIPDEAPDGSIVLTEAPARSKSRPSPPRPAPELKRKESGTRSFKALSDNGWLPSRYKLTYVGQAPNNACNFLLIGKEERELTLELNVPQKLTVSTKGGPMEVTLTYTGLSKTDGARQVEYVVEGGVSAVTGIMERFRNVGPVALSAWQSLKKHLPEAIAIGYAAGIAACGFTMSWIKTTLGGFHPYVTVAVPVIMTGLALWTWAARNKAIRKEIENAE